MDKDLQEKIGKLREVYKDPQDQRLIDDYEKALRRRIVEAELGEHEVIQSIIEDAVKKVVEINMLLAYDKQMTEQKRLELFQERSVHEFWIRRFNPKAAERSVKAFEEFIDKKLDA